MEYLDVKRACDELTEKITKMYHEFKDEDGSRHGLPENIDNLNLHNKILILGLNPSSVNKKNKKKQNSCFIKYLDIDSEDRSINDQLKDFCYTQYFKPNYELVKDLGYNLLWKNKEYLTRQLKIKGQHIGEDAKTFLYDNATASDNFVIFGDLIYLVETNSKKTCKVLNNFKDDILGLLKMQIEYYKPKMIICKNVNVSKFICSCMQKVKVEKIEFKTYDKLNNTPIVFSGMVSSGVLDQFNKIRLKKEVEKIYRSLD